MTHRERVLAALNHEEPDRVPMDLGGSLASSIVGEAYPALREALGFAAHTTKDAHRYAGLAEIEDDVRARLDVDIVHAPQVAGAGGAKAVISPNTFIDEWGVRWHKPEGGHYYVEHAPFEREATPAAVDRHAWPTAEEMIDLDEAVDRLRRLREQTDCAMSLELRGRVMSIGQFLRGFEDWMTDLADNEAFVEALLERTTTIQIEVNDRVLREVGELVDIVYTSDDLGAQDGPLMSPACFRRLLRPQFERIWRHIRETTSATLMHHCCGSIRPFIGNFVELGVQGLNPIQVSAGDMDPRMLKREFGKELTFWGGVDTRDVLPRGTTDDVRQEVQKRIRQMGAGGGYILAAVHNLQKEVPAGNIVAMFEACRAFGGYPLE